MSSLLAGPFATGPITVTIGGREHTGEAVSKRNGDGQVSVQITLDEA